MIRSPKGRLLLVVLTCAVLAGALAWSRRSGPAGYATPAECLEAYREACRAGDAARYRSCLGEPLRSEVRHDYPDDAALAGALGRENRDLKCWVELGPPDAQDERATIDVDEVRETGQRRLRLTLEHTPGGWLVVRVEKGNERTPEVRYGTRVGEEGATP